MTPRPWEPLLEEVGLPAGRRPSEGRAGRVAEVSAAGERLRDAIGSFDNGEMERKEEGSVQ